MCMGVHLSGLVRSDAVDVVWYSIALSGVVWYSIAENKQTSSSLLGIICSICYVVLGGIYPHSPQKRHPQSTHARHPIFFFFFEED